MGQNEAVVEHKFSLQSLGCFEAPNRIECMTAGAETQIYLISN